MDKENGFVVVQDGRRTIYKCLKCAFDCREPTLMARHQKALHAPKVEIKARTGGKPVVQPKLEPEKEEDVQIVPEGKTPEAG